VNSPAIGADSFDCGAGVVYDGHCSYADNPAARFASSFRQQGKSLREVGSIV
jgi:hypothetical protein